jgi:hypothetical protein
LDSSVEHPSPSGILDAALTDDLDAVVTLAPQLGLMKLHNLTFSPTV